MKLSYVIVTRNRRDSLLKTLAILEQNTRLPRHMWEVFVVDNASEDGTAEAVARHHHDATVIRLPENEGVPARNHALRPAQGRYVVFLDDDSYPRDDAIPQSLEYLSRHPKTAALVARVFLPDGSAEAPAMPAITMGGASIVRRTVLEEVGGFAPEFFRQAEEYDMSFRIWSAGYRVERFEDICFGHDKVASGRCSALTRRMDLRNNLILTERYLPRHIRPMYRHDWLRRYAAFGLHEGHDEAMNTAIREARVWARRESSVGRKLLGQTTFEAIFQWKAATKAVAEWGSRRNAIQPRGDRRCEQECVCDLAGMPGRDGDRRDSRGRAGVCREELSRNADDFEGRTRPAARLMESCCPTVNPARVDRAVGGTVGTVQTTDPEAMGAEVSRRRRTESGGATAFPDPAPCPSMAPRKQSAA